MGRRPLPKRISPFICQPLTQQISCGISSPFELLSLTSGQVTNALLTRSPLSTIASTPFDLHVLSTPPAFILSQDQTLRKNCPYFRMVSSLLTGIFRFRFLECRRAHVPMPLAPLFFTLSYHSSVVKVLLIERAGLYHPSNGLSRLLRDQKPMSSGRLDITSAFALSCYRSAL